MNQRLKASRGHLRAVASHDNRILDLADRIIEIEDDELLPSKDLSDGCEV